MSELSRVRGGVQDVSTALAKLFQLTISLKKVNFYFEVFASFGAMQLNLWKTDVSMCITEDNMKKLSKNTTLKLWDLVSCFMIFYS